MRRRDFIALGGVTVRREFMTLVGVAAAAWPLAARAQQGERVRRIAVLTVSAVVEPATQARFAALTQALQQLGWTDRDNLLIDYRAAAGSVEILRQHVTELASLRPEVIVAFGSEAVALLQQATRVLPIVFTDVPDPIGAGFIEGMARP